MRPNDGIRPVRVELVILIAIEWKRSEQEDIHAILTTVPRPECVCVCDKNFFLAKPVVVMQSTDGSVNHLDPTNKQCGSQGKIATKVADRFEASSDMSTE
ncbi:unnamed protein product [Dicrocoelium dendriticum]|nr:unnamed protein product [Dicrocoelium dendriticum]